MSEKGKHNFNASILNWRYCTKCGLIALKNKSTKIAMKKKCDDE